MASATDRFLSYMPSTLGLGPHSTRLIYEAQGAVRSHLWVSVIILAATIIDVIRHEESVFDLGDDEDSYEIGYFDSGGYDYLTMAERKKLEWLRDLRNQLVHYEAPIEGMMGRESDKGVLQNYADRALSAILPVLDHD